jgi:dihydrodipicolinate synthase/N-acetylneuraminate lyase
MTAHLRHMASSVGGLLMPGSTGDGWELTEAETQEVVELALTEAKKLSKPLLIGVLKANAGDALAEIQKLTERFKAQSGRKEALEALQAVGVAGFAVCPPRGGNTTQQEMKVALTAILQTEVPLALYQLPQVTENEMGAELVSELASRYPNFILFKDSSGDDRVALSGLPLHGVFMMRGAENDYVRWSKSNGGPYDGYLLSTANCFAKELNEMIEQLDSGRKGEAEAISERVAVAVREAFALVQGLPQGNAFANANKAMDHFMAHGTGAEDAAPPRLHGGDFLPLEILVRTKDVLERDGLLAVKGYLPS